jgi:hypothetical protein
MRWLPHGWWIIEKKNADSWTYLIGADGIPETKSTENFKSENLVERAAKSALRVAAYNLQDSGWTKFRCHARILGQPKAFCGSTVNDEPNLSLAFSPMCGRCQRIVYAIEDEMS